MFFEAEMKGNKYNLHVNEGRSSWLVGLQKNEGEWQRYEIDKSDFMQMDDAVSFLFKEHCYMVDVDSDGLDYTVYTRSSYRKIHIQNDEMLLHESLKSGGGMGGSDNLSSGMPGKIVKVMVEDGQEFEEGQPLLVMEAMKMENEMRAPRAGKVKKVHVKEAENVESGTVLISFEK